MYPKYINPYTDFGFKKLFGEEASKDVLTDFLNQLLPAHHQITELSFRNLENLPELSFERKAIFDIYCVGVNGERFIVEMQKEKIHFFKDRALFYTSFPIREQGEKGFWNFKLAPIYFIAILDFIYDEEDEKRKFRRDVALKDQDGDLFFDKLHFKFLQMPLFTKTESELETHFDKWLYFLKNLEDFDEIPNILNEPIFQKAFKTAEYAALSPEQRDAYQMNRKVYLDNYNVLETAKEDALEKGRKKGLQEGFQEATLKIARDLKKSGVSAEIITSSTGLTKEDVEEL